MDHVFETEQLLDQITQLRDQKATGYLDTINVLAQVALVHATLALSPASVTEAAPVKRSPGRPRKDTHATG